MSALLEDAPTDAWAYHELGQVDERDDAWEQAAVHFRRAADIARDNVPYWQSLARNMLRLGRSHELVELLRSRVADDTDRQRRRVLRGVLADRLIEVGAYQQARAELGTILRETPRDADAHYRLGWTYDLDGDREQAIESYRDAIDLDPHVVEYHSGLASALTRSGRRTDAVAVLEAALARWPGESRDALFARAGFLHDLERFQEAGERYRTLTRREPFTRWQHAEPTRRPANAGRWP